MPASLRIACCMLVLATLTPTQEAKATAPEPFVVDGCVVDLRGEGVPVAKVWLATWRAQDVRLVETVSDGEGFFRMRVPWQAGLRVFAMREGTCVGSAGVSHETRAVRIEVHDAATVRGVLRGRDGRARRDVVVRAGLLCRTLRETRASARTDAEGGFELTGVPLGPVQLAAFIEGDGLFVTEQVIAGDCEVTLTPFAGATTDVRIEVAGLPTGASGAEVFFRSDLRHAPPPLDAPRLDAAGTFAIEGVPDSAIRVRVSMDGFVIAPNEQVAQPKQGPHVLRFTAKQLADPTNAWHATVRGPDGAPVAGLTMVMRDYAGDHEVRATSDAEGMLTFQCPLAAGSDAFISSADERWSLDQPRVLGMYGFAQPFRLKEHECKVDTSSALALRVVRAGSVKGLVRKPGGKAAALVSVRLETSDGRSSWDLFGRSTTDREGEFVFAGLHAVDHPVRVGVDAAEGAAAGEAFALATAGEEVTAPVLTLDPPASVQGVVFDAQKRPVPGMRVWLTGWSTANRMISGNLVEVLTDRQGRYRFLAVTPRESRLFIIHGSNEGDAFKQAWQQDTKPLLIAPGDVLTFDLEVPAK